MNTAQYNHLFSFLWNIANDVLVHAFEKGEYKKIIMPMIVLRRLDILLEPTKDAVLERKKQLDSANITNQEPVLFQVTGYPFCNTSRFTMKKLKAEVDPVRLKMNFIEYLNGYSKDVQDIIDKFRLRQQVDNLTEAERLGSIIDKFTDSSINLSIKPVVDDKGKEILPALDNHMMGTLFEELLRKFNEENNVTEAGEHFTPRDYVKLLADLAIIPVADQLEDNTYSIYDGACGTGGILTISEEEIKRLAKERGRKININIFGQELQPETFATCKADLMISGERKSFDYILNGTSRQYIAFGSTISEDGHKGETYDFCISNPPFGTPWKEDLKKWGLSESEKKKISDPRFKFVYDEDPNFNVIPGIGDPQMLFLANNISRMKDKTKMGTRIVEVHNGSSLFTGEAGGGESNLRRYIIENDLLEAIIAMPEKDFYNTGIGTYIWIVTNRKEARRKGKVQLIDATSIKSPLRKNLGEKNCETDANDRKKILQLLTNFEENEYSKIFPNEEFGYWQVELFKPVKDENGQIIKDRKGKVKLAKVKGEIEQIPFLYPGGIQSFYDNEVKPYDSEIVFSEPIIGYELSFTKYFYKPTKLHSISELSDNIGDIEKSTAGILNDILVKDIKGVVTRGLDLNVQMKDSGISWIGQIPAHWDVKRVATKFHSHIEPNSDWEYKKAYKFNYGCIIPKNEVGSVEDYKDVYLKYSKVKKKDIIINGLNLNYDFVSQRVAIVPEDGIITSAYVVLRPFEKTYSPYFCYLFKAMDSMKLFHGMGTGIRLTLSFDELKKQLIPIPPIEEQKKIVQYIEERTRKIDTMIDSITTEIDQLNEFKQRFITDLVTGQINVQDEIF